MSQIASIEQDCLRDCANIFFLKIETNVRLITEQLIFKRAALTNCFWITLYYLN